MALNGIGQHPNDHTTVEEFQDDHKLNNHGRVQGYALSHGIRVIKYSIELRIFL